MNRCAWTGANELMLAYHNTEWGVPLHDEQRLFEFLILEGMQAGLSWNTILNESETTRRAARSYRFDHMNRHVMPKKLSSKTKRCVEREVTLTIR